MSGYTRVALLAGLAALILSLGLAAAGIAWAFACIVPVAAISSGYVGGSQSRDDPSKTARNTRRGALAGLGVAALAIAGRMGGMLMQPETAALNAVQDGCLVPFALVLGLAFGGVGGWAYVRHEHERQTGYKPT